MKHGYLKVRCISPDLRVADVKFNTAKLIQAIWDSADAGVKLLVLPELAVTGATCGDLFKHSALISASHSAVESICDSTRDKDIIVVFGAPLLNGARLYNCAVVISNGKILGVVPKKYVGDSARYFCKPALEGEIKLGQGTYPFGNDLIFTCGEFKIGAHLGTDLFSPNGGASALCLAGANIIACPSADEEIVGADSRRVLISKAKSATLACAYLIANACEDESTTDSIYCAHNIICENGKILAECKPFESKNGDTISEIDASMLNHIKMQRADTAEGQPVRCIPFHLKHEKTTLTRKIDKFPFIADNEAEQAKRSEKILTMQAHALARRLVASHSKCAVFGVSGGLDSTLALLVIARAYDYLGWQRGDICAVTMPCFGTTARTKSNAYALCEELGATVKEINISASVKAHLADIGHSEDNHNVTFENAQARERTQVLMDLANDLGGLVVGTGDLSEIALGWSTYNADHMSMYNPNCSIPKTLVRYLVAYEASRLEGRAREALLDILDTPVSPELLPPADGKIVQKTEDLVGPYELHDFFLYSFARYGFAPSKLYRLARLAFAGEFEDEVIYKWLVAFIKRFFTQQFKRSCSPDGVKVGTVALSPRGGLKMPSDSTYWVWLDELEANKNY